MASPLPGIIDDLLHTMWQGDLDRFRRLFDELYTKARGRSAAELTEAIEHLAPILARRPQGVFAELALIAGACVEWGGSPVALAKAAPTSAVMTMILRVGFSDVWPQVSGGRPEPDLDDPPGMTDLISLFRSAAGELGIPEPAAAAAAVSWFDAPHWISLMITLLTYREFRDVADLRGELAEEAQKLDGTVRKAHWLSGLALVLDDEPLVVIDHATGRGYRLTMSGIGDNYQLHTLLADRLIGDPALGLIPGQRPEPSWVAAATTGPPEVPFTALIQRRRRLFDATGTYISPEGRPSDIATVNGVRLLVLHPSRNTYGWNAGRVYPSMTPTLALDEILTSEAATTWHNRAAPANETDIFSR